MTSDTQGGAYDRAAGLFASACLFLVPVVFAGISLALGQDANWDLRNYHWYNPYAFLTGRLPVDLGVAHVATYYNPLLDVPVYLIGSVVPACVVGALLGFVHGLNFLLLYAIARRVMPVLGSHNYSRALAGLVALIGMLGGGHLGMVGTTYNDNIVSLGVLGAMLLIVRHADVLFAGRSTVPTRADLACLVGAGLLTGAVVGLKLPTAIFAVGLCAALLCVAGGFQRRIALAFVFGVAVLVGFAVTGGPWMWVLWRDYANPLFPYFNTFFNSPMGVDNNYRDLRFVPDNWAARLFFPVVFSLNPFAVGELTFRDYRVVAAFGALLLTGVLVVAGCVSRRSFLAPLPAASRYVIAASVLSYLPWQLVFGIYRYIVTLEMLAPLLLLVTVAAWPAPARARMAGIGLVLALVTVFVQRAEWSHEPWQDGPFVTATPPPIPQPDRALALISGMDPVGYLVPFFPPQIPFIRIQGFLNGPDQPPNGLNDRVRAVIAAHHGDFFLLTPKAEFELAENSLRAYGLAADFAGCMPVASNLGDRARWCRVYPVSKVQNIPSAVQ